VCRAAALVEDRARVVRAFTDVAFRVRAAFTRLVLAGLLAGARLAVVAPATVIVAAEATATVCNTAAGQCTVGDADEKSDGENLHFRLYLSDDMRLKCLL